MKKETLVNKLDELVSKPFYVASIGDISLAIKILEKAKESNPQVYERLRSLIP